MSEDTTTTEQTAEQAHAQQEQQERESKKVAFTDLFRKHVEAIKKDQEFDIEAAKKELGDEQEKQEQEQKVEEENPNPKLDTLLKEEEKDDEEEDDPDFTPSPWHDITVDDFVNKDGRPISEESKMKTREAFEGLKRKMRKYEKDYHKISKKYEALLAEHEPIKKEVDEIKKWRSDRYFEDSPEFQESFVTPVKESEDKIKFYLENAGIEPDSREEQDVKRNLAFLAKHAAEGDEVKFNQYVDKLADLFEGKVTQTKFIGITDHYFQKVQGRNRALKDKESARKEILAKDAELIAGSRPVVEEIIRSHISQYEQENEQFVEFFRSDKAKDFFKYDETIEQGKKKAADLISEMVTNRRPSKELLHLVTRGIIGDIAEKEKRALAQQQEDQKTVITNLKEELRKTKDILAKLQPSRTKTVSTPKKEEKKDFYADLRKAFASA